MPGTLLIVISQSGASAEVEALLEQLPAPRPVVLGVVNELDSPLARGADVVIELHAGPELAVGTRSYVNTLAACALLASAAVGGDAAAELRTAVGALAHYLGRWRERVEEVTAALLPAPRLVVLGRGPSLAAARTGALIVKEAAKVHAEGLSSSEFRHGPLELVDEHLSAVMLPGPPATSTLNARLAADIAGYGGRVGWLGASGAPEGTSAVAAPNCGGAAAPVGEIVPLQLLCVALAEAAGIEPGVFRYLQKVTRVL
jgi:glucosamine--fructose-6-phosphate aminotransferase (isomerizing)